MGTMEKMRNSTPIILWVLIFSFGILWVLQDTQVFDAMTVGPQYIGSVNGERISLEEYNSTVQYYTQQYSQQTGQSLSAEMRTSLEEQAWQDLLNDRLRSQKMDELGITVTDEELVSMVTGSNPDPFIRQQFSDEEGNIDQIALRTAIEAPENREIWMSIEQQLRQTRRQEKLSRFISGGLRASSAEVERVYVNENSYADISYIRFPYAEVSDDEIEVSEQELRTYYNDNPDFFQREESYNIRYIAFEKTPTAEDTLRTVQEIEELIPDFAEAEDHADFLQRFGSAVPWSDTFVPVEDIREEYSPVIDLEPGEVSELTMINGNPHVFKKVAQEGDEINFAVLAYTVTADPVATLDRLADEADEFSFYADLDGFENEAENRGYDITQINVTHGATFIPGLGQAGILSSRLEQMNPGDVSGVIDLSAFYVVAELVQKTPAGTRPFEEVRNQIENTLRNLKRSEIAVRNATEQVGSASDLETIAETTGRDIQVLENIEKSSLNIPGAGFEPAVIGAVFAMDSGETSSVIEGESAAFVVSVNDIEIANPANMSATQRSEIETRLEQQKIAAFGQVWLEELKEEATIRDNRHYFLAQ